MRPGALVTFIVVSLLATPGAFAMLTDRFQNDANTGGDAGDSMGDATPITAGAYGGQTYMIDDPADWYTFAVQGPPDVPVVEVHVSFTLSSPTCLGLQIPVSLQSVDVDLLDPKGDPKGHFTTDGCRASGGFDVYEPLTGGENQTVTNPGIGNWTLGFIIRGVGANPIPLDPTGITQDLSVSQAAPPALVAGHAPHGSASPPNPEQDYMLMLGCRPHC